MAKGLEILGLDPGTLGSQAPIYNDIAATAEVKELQVRAVVKDDR